MRTLSKTRRLIKITTGTLFFQLKNVLRSVSEAKAVNYYHKALHLGCCSSPGSASECRTYLNINWFGENASLKDNLTLQYI